MMVVGQVSSEEEAQEIKMIANIFTLSKHIGLLARKGMLENYQSTHEAS